MKNMYENHGEYVVIIVERNGEYHEVLIDAEDFHAVSSFKGTWHLNNRGYVSRTINNKRESMHRYLIKPPENMVIDHINRNRLDNRKANLRIITRSQNAQNIKGNKRSKSGIRGVSLDSRWGERWRARIRVNGKDISLGNFDTEEEAEQAVIEGRKKYFPYSTES